MGNKVRLDYFQNTIVKKNFFYNIFDGSLFAFGMSFVSLQTVLPLLVKRMSGSDIAVGLIPVVWLISFNFPQILVSNHIRKLEYKKPWMIKTALVQRIPWLVLGFIILFVVGEIDGKTAVIFFFAGLFVAALGSSINYPGWFDLISKITPVQLRGRLFAYRTVFGAFLGILGGWIIAEILELFTYPLNFSLLFFIGFAITMVSFIFLTLLKEEDSNPPKQIFASREFVNRLFSMLKEENNFRNFLIADSLMMLSLMSHAFFTVHAIEKFSLPDTYAGYFTMVMMISMILGTTYFGYLADKKGHKVNLIWAAGFTITACIFALISPSVEFYFICFAGTALTISLHIVSRFNIVAELCLEDDRPTYISLTNFITAPFVLSGLLGGWIVNTLGYNTVFIIAGLFATASVIWFSLMVNDPREIYRVVNK